MMSVTISGKTVGPCKGGASNKDLNPTAFQLAFYLCRIAAAG